MVFNRRGKNIILLFFKAVSQLEQLDNQAASLIGHPLTAPPQERRHLPNYPTKGQTQDGGSFCLHPDNTARGEISITINILEKHEEFLGEKIPNPFN